MSGLKMKCISQTSDSSELSIPLKVEIKRQIIAAHKPILDRQRPFVGFSKRFGEDNKTMTTDFEQRYNAGMLALHVVREELKKEDAFMNDKMIDVQSYNTKNDTPKQVF